MSEKLDIFADTRCPSLEVLNRYLDDGLNLKDQQQLEQHMLDCPMCTDALEGLNMVEDRIQLGARVHRIKTESKHRLYETALQRENPSKRRSRVKPRQFTQYAAAAAAAVFILWMSVFIYQDMNQAQHVYEKHFAEATEAIAPPAGTTDAMLQTDSIRLSSTTAKESETDLLAQTKEIPIKTEAPVALREEGPSSPQPVSPTDANAFDKSQEDSGILPDNEVSEDVVDDELLAANQFRDDFEGEENEQILAPVRSATGASSTEVIPNQAPTSISLDEVKVTSERRERESMEDRKSLQDTILIQRQPSYSQNASKVLAGKVKKDPAIANYSQMQGVQLSSPYQDPDMITAQALYSQGDFAAAIQSLELVLDKYPAYVAAHFLRGNSHLELGQPSQAIPSLKLVVKSADKAYFEEAQWKLAGAYLLRNRKQPARKLLKQIIDTKGPYSEKARSALEDL